MATKSKGNAAVRYRDPLIERWANVERVLEAMPEHARRHHWNMATWGEKTDCGTVACAAGQCGLDPWFRRRGFKLNFHKGDNAAQISDVEAFFGFEGSKRIFFKSTPRPVTTVIGEVRGYLGELKRIEQITAGLSLPKIGEEWPEQGGIFAGARLGADDAPAYLLIVGPEYDGFINWNDAKAWAAKLADGEHHDFILPNRSEGVALYSRVKSLFKPSVYWLSEQHAGGSDTAWGQSFSHGGQGCWRKDDDGRARAVRRFPIQ